jgi:DNA mismatch repair protein MutS
MLDICECFSPACQPCITNDLQLNKDSGNQNLLLTGPNGSGKSTYLKSVMSAVILAQTVGMAPAKTMEFTPFAHLSTYLNIPDCQGKESLFQAEMTRCHDHLAMLRELESQPGKFSFNIMDEIFVSTNYLEGMSGAYAVIKSLGTLTNSLHIITTHFDKLTDPETPIPGYVYKHFTIDVDPVDDSVILKDYKLRDGVNRKHMALHLLKLRGFDSGLVESAREMYSKLVEAESTDKVKTNGELPSSQAVDSQVPNSEDPVEEINKQPEETNDSESAG